jgi:thiamine biosynthesis lipoprotein
MGTRVNLVFYAATQSSAERAAQAAFARWAELEQIMSDYRPTSELMKLCERAASGPSRISRDLFVVLERAQEVSESSGGAFDVTLGPLTRLWRETRRTRVLPTEEALREAKSMVGWQQVLLDRRTRSVTLTRHGVSIDLGGIAKGYACDQAILALKRLGIDRAMVEAGGDLAVSGAPPGKPGWRVEIRGSAEPPLVVSHCAVSTSGDAEQFVEIGGVRYAHIVDPKTGLGLTRRIQATVVAKNGLTTDPLATAACVLGEAEGSKLAAKYGARVVFVVGGHLALN